jgi:hypothetical protein
MSQASESPVRCARRGCTASHPGSRHDNIRAQGEGWFHSRRDDAHFCPEHVPGWVPEWRARQAAKKETASA